MTNSFDTHSIVYDGMFPMANTK